MILYLVHDVRDARLELHVRPGEGVRHAVFDWIVQPGPIDAGPPPLVAEVFAEALAAIGLVAFLDEPAVELPSGAWRAVGRDHWLALAPTWRRPRFALVATRDPERIRTMFDGAASWSQRAQAGFVLGDALAVLPRALVDRVIGARDAPLASLGLPSEVRMLVLPAVDGALIEIAARDDGGFDDLRAGIEAACRTRAIGFEVRPALFTGHSAQP
jgi:hypothetical protein